MFLKICLTKIMLKKCNFGQFKCKKKIYISEIYAEKRKENCDSFAITLCNMYLINVVVLTNLPIVQALSCQKAPHQALYCFVIFLCK